MEAVGVFKITAEEKCLILEAVLFLVLATFLRSEIIIS